MISADGKKGKPEQRWPEYELESWHLAKPESSASDRYAVIAAALSSPMATEIAARKIPEAVFPSLTSRRQVRQNRDA